MCCNVKLSDIRSGERRNNEGEDYHGINVGRLPVKKEVVVRTLEPNMGMMISVTDLQWA